MDVFAARACAPKAACADLSQPAGFWTPDGTAPILPAARPAIGRPGDLMILRRTSSLLFVSAAGALCAACPPPPQAGETLTLGLVNPATGSLASYGPAIENGVQLALQQVNAAGGVLGRQLELDIRDSQTDRDAAKAAAQALVDDGVPVIFGDAASGNTLAMSEVTVPAKVVQISGASTSPLITDHADDGYLFRTVPSDAFQGVVLADEVYADGHRTASILHLDNAYGGGLADVFAARFEENGGTVNVQRSFPENPPADHDFQADIDAAAANGTQAIVLVAYVGEGTSMLQTWNSNPASFAGAWYLTDGIKTDDLIANVGADALEGIEGTAPLGGAGEGFGTFKSAYEQAFGEPPGIYSESYYDAVILAAFAIEKAGSDDPTAIRDALHEVSGPPGTKIAVGAVEAGLSAIAAGEDVDYDGASGPVDFDEKGEVSGPVEIWRVTDGAYERARVVQPE